MSPRPLKVLELNDVDIYGARFNGYNLVNYVHSLNRLKFTTIDIKLIVNHKFSNNKDVVNLYMPGLGQYDYQIQQLEKDILATKGQISIAEESLVRSKYYKEADILHFHMYHNMNLPTSFLTRIPADKKIILELHDTYWLTDEKIPMLEVFNYSDINQVSLNEQRQKVLNSIDAEFIVHSEYMLNLFKKSTTTQNLKNVHLIDFGINPDVFRPLETTSTDLRKKYHITNNIVLFCRAQKEFKGASYILEALKLIQEPVTLITVGESKLFDELKPFHQILDMGLISDEQTMVELYNACDVFLAPSTEESFGFMAIEAMACEKPVIVFDGTALPFTTNAPEIGVLANNTSRGLADSILDLINDKEDYLRRSEAGRKFVCEKYSLEKYYGSYVDLFNKLGAKKARSISYPSEDMPQDKDVKFEQQLSFITQNLLKKSVPLAETSAQVLSFNYADTAIQNELYSYNKMLYNKLMAARLRPVNIAKKILRKIIGNHG